MSFNVRPLERKPSLLKRWAGTIAATITIVRPLVAWYCSWKAAQKRIRRIGALKRVLTVLIATLAALLLLAGVVRAVMMVSGVGVTEMMGVAGTPPPTDEHGYTNILLMGQGDEDHDGKDLTDTVMIGSIDPKTRSAVLLSLPRDLYFLSTEKMGKGKLNTFYRDYKSYLRFQKGMDEQEASSAAIRELSMEIGRSLGMEIHHAVKVDFIGFVKAVDALGGVDIDVPYDIDDPEYPNTTYGFEPFVLKAGMRHLDGETALKYARSRHTSSDFGRSARQQQLLSALADQAREKGMLRNAGAITSLFSIVSEHSETTLTVREILGLAAAAESIEKDKILSLQLNDRNALYDSYIEPGGFLYTPPRDQFEGAAVLLPVSIPEFPVTWKQIKTFTTLLAEHRNIHLAKPTFAVLNAGAAPGTARRLSNELVRYGFTVERTENADSGKQDTSLILVSPEPDPAMDFFVKLLGLPTGPAPENFAPAQRSRITILLGKDYRYVPIQDLMQNLTSTQSPITNNQ
ncbi:LCP family protein [Candidatus Peregrinibacteria bacterium]|nr:LCP family protein [Candidatus Peregrinibacteria bacterium]